jgi:hypothetical protein
MEIWKALKFLYPNAQPLVDYVIRDDSDGRGPYIDPLAWHLPDPIPGLAQLQTASDAFDAAQAQRQADAAALRQKVLNVAQSAVGQGIDTLTAVQVRALMACLLFKAGALDKAGVVQPLSEWL